MSVEINESGRCHQAFGIDHALGARKFLGDLAIGDIQVAGGVAAACRVDEARVLDRKLH